MAVDVASYDHRPSDVPFLGETIGRCLRRVAREQGDHEAVVSIHEGVRLTYRGLLSRAEDVARGLLSLGVARGDRVAVWSTNAVGWVIIQHATALVGAVLVNVNPAFRSHELEHVLRASRARVLFLGEGFRGTPYPEMLYELCPEIRASNGATATCEALPALEWAVSMDSRSQPGLMTLADLERRGVTVASDAISSREADLDFDDDINIQYTSGTTGLPKGVTLSHHNILNNAYFTARTMALGPEDRLCVAVPFYHCFGMVLGTLACLTSGACLVIPSAWFDPTDVLGAVQGERCTALHGVPTMFIAELNDPDFDRFDLSSLRTGIMAGAPCPIDVVHDVMQRMHMREVLIGYGQTEASPIATLTQADDPVEKRAETVGRAAAHQELKIIEPHTGGTVNRGQVGEICFRGYHVMRRYDADPGATAEAVDAQGWLHSGDLGTMDVDGYVKIVGRIKEMVIRGGENVYPREIEEFLHTLDIVVDAYVIGVPDYKYGEDLMAWVSLVPGVEPPSTEEFREMCRGRIASFKIPRYWKVVDEFPMTVTGKAQKFEMRARAIEELGLRAAAEVRTA
jgi:fatty-acyl-CoA synthase